MQLTRKPWLSILGVIMLTVSVSSKDESKSRRLRPTIDADGTVHVPAFSLPLSSYMSAEAGVALIKRMTQAHAGDSTLGDAAIQLLESIPVSALARIKMVSIDYRMSPEHKFPAASEDVAAVYKNLLKQYAPGNIGIYGCSVGGILTADRNHPLRPQRHSRPISFDTLSGLNP